MGPTSFLNSTVGEYRLTEFLGAGGMGEVYRAVHSKIGRVAAVKVLTQATQSHGFVERFFNEARIQASLQHPNIATLYDFCEAAGQPCIIMEYVDGQTVAERVAAYGALPLAEAVYVFERVVEAVEYIHCHGIIHRDIKSNNIKVSSEGQVKLLDFGIAKAQTSPGLTQVGSVIGTLQYLAPELIRGGTADARGDIWALGVLLYETVTGRVPFEATTVGDLCDKIDRVAYAPPAQLNPEVPREVAHIISRCLRKNPAERYASARDLLADVKRLSATVARPGLSERVSEAASEYAGAKSGGSSKLLLAAGAVAGVFVLAVFAALLYAFTRPSDTQAAPDDSVNVSKGANAANIGNTAKGLASNVAHTPDAQERDVEIRAWDLHADAYRGGEKVGTTPFIYRGRLGEHVALTLKLDGYEDEPLVFDITEQRKSVNQPMTKLARP
jgi:serine/threonine-protein kinase